MVVAPTNSYNTLIAPTTYIVCFADSHNLINMYVSLLSLCSIQHLELFLIIFITNYFLQLFFFFFYRSPCCRLFWTPHFPNLLLWKFKNKQSQSNWMVNILILTTYILQITLYYSCFIPYLSIPLCIQPSIMFLMHFAVSCRHQYTPLIMKQISSIW